MLACYLQAPAHPHRSSTSELFSCLSCAVSHARADPITVVLLVSQDGLMLRSGQIISNHHAAAIAQEAWALVARQDACSPLDACLGWTRLNKHAWVAALVQAGTLPAHHSQSCSSRLLGRASTNTSPWALAAGRARRRGLTLCSCRHQCCLTTGSLQGTLACCMISCGKWWWRRMALTGSTRSSKAASSRSGAMSPTSLAACL